MSIMDFAGVAFHQPGVFEFEAISADSVRERQGFAEDGGGVNLDPQERVV